MARAINFEINGEEISSEIIKVDRDKLYGKVEKKYVDRDGHDCYFGSVSDDGVTIFGREAFEMGYRGEGGDWLERSVLRVVDDEGGPLEKMDSIFNQAIELNETVSINVYLNHVAKSVYQLSAPNLLAHVQAQDEIFVFPFSYTASYSQDPAFLIENNSDLFMVVGQPTGFEFLEMEEVQLPPLEDDDEEEEDDIDFSMF